MKEFVRLGDRHCPEPGRYWGQWKGHRVEKHLRHTDQNAVERAPQLRVSYRNNQVGPVQSKVKIREQTVRSKD
jgi:hypothetical protein